MDNSRKKTSKTKSMAGNITLTMIKPVALNKGFAGAIIDKIIKAGFRCQAMKMVKLSKEQAEAFYEVHRDKAFFNDLVKFMTSGPIIAAILEKENAVEAYRNFIGSTNPSQADDGTIRKTFGSSIQANAVHGSDSDENAIKEAAFFFSRFERY